MLRYLSAGESHGKALVAIIEGLPANLTLDLGLINQDLRRRQGGYGRGNRMKIEKDQVQVLTGLRGGKTLGSPLTLIIPNLDYENWTSDMDSWTGKEENPITRPRPGHGDLVGALKYNHRDIRNVLERASARETAIRTAVGSVAKQLIATMNMKVLSHVTSIGNATIGKTPDNLFEMTEMIESSPVRCLDPVVAEKMMAEIKGAKEKSDSLGGSFEVVVYNPLVGLGSYVHEDRKLDGKLAQGMMSLQGIKAIEIGEGFRGAQMLGTDFHDEIFYDPQRGYYRQSNNSGGIEAGMSNGENIVLRAYMKPIPTVMQPLSSIDMGTKEEIKAAVERSDYCAVPAASIVGEAICSWVIAKEVLLKFGSDHMDEILDHYNRYLDYLKGR